MLFNHSFETGIAPWTFLHYAFRTAAYASQGVYSVGLAGYNNSEDAVGQYATVPSWAETSAVDLDSLMFSSEPATGHYDDLAIAVFDSHSNLIAAGYVWNDAPRAAWMSWYLPVPEIASYRGQSISVLIVGFTDSSNPTWWYVDDVHLIFACGGYVAEDGLHAQAPRLLADRSDMVAAERLAEFLRNSNDPLGQMPD